MKENINQIYYYDKNNYNQINKYLLKFTKKKKK